jgi:hypothetical protein
MLMHRESGHGAGGGATSVFRRATIKAVTDWKLHSLVTKGYQVYNGYLARSVTALTMTTQTLASKSITAPDLTVRPPRSLRCRLGGYTILPRMLDKCRAVIAGTAGEYHFNCPLDQQFIAFVGIDAVAFKAELSLGRTDTEMLNWVQKNAAHPRADWEIEAWSNYQQRRQPLSDPDTLSFFSGLLATISTSRTDVHAWADLLDLDDHVSFGGTA